MIVRKLGFLLFILSVVSVVGWGDISTASLSGTITDEARAVLAGADVVVRNLDTGISRSAVTNTAGIYQLSGLQAGRYEISVSAKKFAPVQQKNVSLRVGDEVRIDFSLPLAQRREVIEVNGSTPLVQTETATACTVINERAIQDLPTDGRQLQNLALQTPGIDAGWNVSTAANRYGKARENTEGAFSVNGNRSRANDFLFDGMPMNLRQYNVINFEPSNEAVKEFAVLSDLPSAEYGHSMGGQINIITRAGSSQYHGSGYEFFRNDALNANDTLSNRAGLPRGIVRHHQFGGSIGGPIWKQKHFFFANVELLRNSEASETHTSNVPTTDERNGLIPYQDVNGNPQVVNLAGSTAPISARLVGFYPQPNASLPGGNYVASLGIQLHDYQFHIRTDHHLTDRDSVTARVSWNLNDQVYVIDRFGGPYIPGFPLPNPEKTFNGTVSYFHTFSSAMMDNAQLGVNRYSNALANGDSRNAAQFGLPNGSDANGIPAIVFAQGGLAGLGGLPWYNRDQNELMVHASDVVSIMRSSHSLRVGGEFSRLHFNTRGATDQRGTLYFDGSQNNIIPKTPANSLANTLTDLLLGLPFEATITTGQFGRGYREWVGGVFVQDNWRMTHRLTLNYGLRYEYSAPWTEVNNKLSNFVPGLGIITPQSPLWDGLYKPDRNNFAPRAGFVYDLTGKGRTIVRGGFGIYYETNLQASTVQQIENNQPFSSSAITFAPTPFSHDPNQPTSTLLTLRGDAKPSNSVSAIPQDLRNPYSMQFSLDVQQALAKNWLLELGYRGTRGVHLPTDFNINQVPLDALSPAQRVQIAALVAAQADTTALIETFRPFPGFNSISLFSNDATSTYHSLQFKVEGRLSHGLNLLSAYTFSKAIDDATDFASSDASEQVLNSYDRDLQRAVSSFDVKHRFTAAFNYAIPAPGWKALLGGWEVNGIITVQSGQPFTPFTSQFDPYRGESFNRLNVISNPGRGAPSGSAYNPLAFALPTLGTFGNSGRNIVRGDGFRSADLSLFRNFAIRERLHLQMRFEATNAFNQVNYQGPITDQNTTPGAFVATALPRTLQLGAKISF